MFRVICADPPWPTKRMSLATKCAADHYPLMPMEEIYDYLKGSEDVIADDCVLFLWRLASMAEEALKVCHAWGFEPKSEVVWVKTTVNGNRHFGMGRYVKGEHEVCIIARRGKYIIKPTAIRSCLFEAPVGKHSAKPEFFYTEIVEKLVDGPYLEMFARKRRPGWTCVGNELMSSQ